MPIEGCHRYEHKDRNPRFYPGRNNGEAASGLEAKVGPSDGGEVETPTKDSGARTELIPLSERTEPPSSPSQGNGGSPSSDSAQQIRFQHSTFDCVFTHRDSDWKISDLVKIAHSE